MRPGHTCWNLAGTRPVPAPVRELEIGEYSPGPIEPSRGLIIGTGNARVRHRFEHGLRMRYPEATRESMQACALQTGSRERSGRDPLGDAHNLWKSRTRALPPIMSASSNSTHSHFRRCRGRRPFGASPVGITVPLTEVDVLRAWMASRKEERRSLADSEGGQEEWVGPFVSEPEQPAPRS